MNLETFFRDNDDWRPHADLVAYPPTPAEMMKEYTDVNPEVLARCMEFVSEGGGVVTRGAIYLRIRHEDKKAGDKWAAMLALQAPPGVQTTDTFWAGRKSWVDVFGERYANTVKEGFARKGINIPSNAEYMPELVRPGYGPKNPDPEAIVPFGGGRSYIKRICEQRGWSCHGAVNVEEREPDSDPLAPENCVALAPNIIRKKMKEMVKQNPSLKRVPRQALRERVLAKYGPSK